MWRGDIWGRQTKGELSTPWPMFSSQAPRGRKYWVPLTVSWRRRSRSWRSSLRSTKSISEVLTVGGGIAKEKMFIGAGDRRLLRPAQVWARSNLYADFFRLLLLRWREVPRPFAVLATVRVLVFSSTIFRRLCPPPLPFHRFPQELVDPCLITTPLALQPRQHIGVHADRHRPFDGTVKLPHHRPSPFPHFRRIRQIDFLVPHARQRSQFLCLLPRGLLHRSSFPAASPFAPRSSAFHHFLRPSVSSTPVFSFSYAPIRTNSPPYEY